MPLPSQAIEPIHVQTGYSGMVTVVLPVYNGERYLDEAIRSVRNQSYKNWELIVVDDGSTDGSANIAVLHARADARIRFVRQPNRKLPAALNAGFYCARGDYYTWISADNRILPDFLERMVRELEEHPNWDMVKANMRIIDEQGAPLRGTEHILPFQDPSDTSIIRYPEDTSIMERQTCNVVGGAFLYRSVCGKLLGDYDPTYFTAEDYEYWLRMREFFAIRQAGFDDPIYEYRIHRASLTSQANAYRTVQLSEQLLRYHSARLPVYRAELAFSIVSAPAVGEFAQLAVETAIRQCGHQVVTASTTLTPALYPNAVILSMQPIPPFSNRHFTLLITPPNSQPFDLPFDIIATCSPSATINQSGHHCTLPNQFRAANLMSAVRLIAAKMKLILGNATHR